MNPLQEYNELILNRQSNPHSSEVKCHKHHIVPRSCGGLPKARRNLVRLTLEEHYKAHYYLTFIYAEGKNHENMVLGWYILDRRFFRGGIGKFIIGEDEWNRLNDEVTSIRSSLHKGKATWNKGKHGLYQHSEESKRKMSESRTGQKRTDTTKQRISSALKGHRNALGCHRSEAFKKRISEARKAYWARRKACNE